MTRQYLRKVRVSFSGSGGGLVVNPGDETDLQLKVEFSVSKDMSGSANTASITIYNLSREHALAIGKELDDVTLEAGYIGNVGTIFKGQMRDVEIRREGPDLITTVSCGDGDKALRNATLSKTFKKGTKVKEVIEELHKEFEKQGVDRGEWKGVDDLPEHKRPVSVCSSCSREMDRIGRSNGLYWSIQNGALEIVPANEALRSVVFLSPETGLIGTPTITDNGVKFKAFLNPDVRPNRMVEVECETLELNSEGGQYRVSSATYSGDNRDGDFTVDGVGERLENDKIDGGLSVPSNIPVPTARLS